MSLRVAVGRRPSHFLIHPKTKQLTTRARRPRHLLRDANDARHTILVRVPATVLVTVSYLSAFCVPRRDTHAPDDSEKSIGGSSMGAAGVVFRLRRPNARAPPSS